MTTKPSSSHNPLSPSNPGLPTNPALLRHAEQRGLRCLRVIHGKGHGSPGREPVLA